MPEIRPSPQGRDESARSWAYRVILEAIVRLDLKPTATLDFGELEAVFGLSRTPIREALIQLEREGFVRLKPQRGSYVAPIDLDEVEKARFIRLCLEKEVIVRACDRRDAALLRSLRYLLDCQREALDANDDRRLYELDEDFHRAYYDSCGRGNIWDYLRGANLHFYRLRVLNMTIKDMRLLTYQNHEDIREALSRRDRGAAVAAIEAHLDLGNWSVGAVMEKTPEWFIRGDGTACRRQRAV